MRSFFIGFGKFLWYVFLIGVPPLSLLWIWGERVQGRKGVKFYDDDRVGTDLGAAILTSSLIWAFVIVGFLIAKFAR